MTGPGGSGKTRLVGRVAGPVAGRFEDGVWLAELAAVRDPALAAVVAAALGVREQPGVPAADALARVLARLQLLLVLDNCEHVIGAAAALCAGLLLACDDMRILATSREPLRVAGEGRSTGWRRCQPGSDDRADAAGCKAVALFADLALYRFKIVVRRLTYRFSGSALCCPVVLADDAAEDLAALYWRVQSHDGHLVMVGMGVRCRYWCGRCPL